MQRIFLLINRDFISLLVHSSFLTDKLLINHKKDKLIKLLNLLHLTKNLLLMKILDSSFGQLQNIKMEYMLTTL